MEDVTLGFAAEATTLFYTLVTGRRCTSAERGEWFRVTGVGAVKDDQSARRKKAACTHRHAGCLVKSRKKCNISPPVSVKRSPGMTQVEKSAC